MTTLLGNDGASALGYVAFSGSGQVTGVEFTVATDGTATEAVVDIGDAGRDFKVLVYNDAEALVSEGRVSSSIVGDNVVTLDTPIVMTTGEIYRLCIFCAQAISVGKVAATTLWWRRDTGTYPTAPDPFVIDQSGNEQERRFFLRAVNPSASTTSDVIPPANNSFVDLTSVAAVGDRIIARGTPQNITNITAASPAVITITGHGFSNGDQVYIDSTGVSALDGSTFAVANVTTNTFEVSADGTGWTTGGTAAPDLKSGDHIRHESILYQGATPTAYTVTVNADATYTISGGPVPDGTYNFEVRAYDEVDDTWGTAADQTVVIDSGGTAIPSDDRVSVNKIAYALMDTGQYVSVQVNDIVVEWLRTEGQVGGNLNQMLYSYLGTLGYTGSLDDRMKAWSRDP